LLFNGLLDLSSNLRRSEIGSQDRNEGNQFSWVV
jgi:hypothetical protein